MEPKIPTILHRHQCPFDSFSVFASLLRGEVVPVPNVLNGLTRIRVPALDSLLDSYHSPSTPLDRPFLQSVEVF